MSRLEYNAMPGQIWSRNMGLVGIELRDAPEEQPPKDNTHVEEPTSMQEELPKGKGGQLYNPFQRTKHEGINFDGRDFDPRRTGLKKLPPNLPQWRERLFNIPNPSMSILPVDMDWYWPFVDNFWHGLGHPMMAGKKLSSRYQFSCRFAQPKPATEWEPHPDPSKRRNRSTFLGSNCPARLLIRVCWEENRNGELVRRADNSVVRVRPIRYELLPNGEAHNHSLEDMDKHRLNSFVRAAIGCAVIGNDAAGALKRIKANDGDRLILAGGLHVQRRHVLNVMKIYKEWQQPDLGFVPGPLKADIPELWSSS